MSINVEVKRKITVDGKDYDSLDQLPDEVRTAILKTLAAGPTNSRTTVHINGKAYSSVDDFPAPLRGIITAVAGAVLQAQAGKSGMGKDMERIPGTIRPERTISLKKFVFLICLIAFILWLFQHMP